MLCAGMKVVERVDRRRETEPVASVNHWNKAQFGEIS